MMASGDPRWLSFKQATDKGWKVRKGERASRLFFFKRVEVKSSADVAEDAENGKMVPVLRSFPVFHASQVDGIPDYSAPTPAEVPWRTPESASVVVTRSGAMVREGGDKAFYSPAADSIQMPSRAAFTSAQGWASTILHELGHWTGHPSRLNRNLAGRFGTQAYAMEELRAELASAFIGTELGLPSQLEQHASYIDSWLSVLKKDKREIFRAAADAQRIADHLLAFHPLYAAQQAAERRSDTVADTTSPLPVAPPPGPMPAHIRRSLGRDRQPEAVMAPPAPMADPAPAFRPR